jgi:hypothetical protein
MKRVILIVVPFLLFALSILLERETDTQKQVESLDEVGGFTNPPARTYLEWMKTHSPRTGRIPKRIREREMEFARSLPTRDQLASLAKSEGGASVITNWIKRGPYNLGGRTRAAAYDISNVNVILAGGVSGGMWRSTNTGASWTKVTTPSQLHSATCITQDRRTGQTNVWYYGTGERRGNSASGATYGDYRGDGIFKSTNGGVSWTLLSSTSSGFPHIFNSVWDYVWSIETDVSNTTQAEVYAATYGSLQRSTNGGVSWTPVLGNTSPYAEYTDVKLTTTGVVYSAASSGTSMSGIRRSTDGITWSTITPAGFPTTYGRIVLAIAPSNENIVYCLASVGNGHQLWIYNSGTGGWTNRSANLPPGFDSQTGYDLVVQVRPTDPNFVLLGGVTLYRSTDGFATPHTGEPIGGPLFAPGHHADQHALLFQPGNASVVLSAHDGGLSRTTDITVPFTSIVWTSLSNGYVTSQFYSVALDHLSPGNNIVVGGAQDNGTWFGNSTSPTASWRYRELGDGSFCAIANSRTSYYFSSQFGVVFRQLLTDQGLPAGDPYRTRVDPAGATGQVFISPFILIPNFTNRMIYAAGNRLWRNTNLTEIPLGGTTPTTVNWSQLTNTVIAGDSITALEHTYNAPSDRLYYGTKEGKVFRLDGTLGTGNPTPVDIYTGKGLPSNVYVSSLACDLTDGNKVLLAFSNYEVISLYYTTNGGNTWSAVAGNLEQFGNGNGNGPSVRWVEITAGRNNIRYYFAGTSTGLYSTETLSGTSTVWVQEGATTIGNVVVDMIDSRQSDGVVVVGTHGAGIFSGQVPLPLDADEQREIPSAFALHQNYPNPFNPTTTIRFSIPVSGRASLKVFDMAGREIATLLDEHIGAGSHQRSFDASGLSSGVYVTRLAVEGRVMTRKMMLLR